ncbi:hypothetical protein Q31a_41670 [Aureliella helgolandensis]|uniref:Uncharacterized protein n=1 Tax=Aureliella helgolandensis TaxID=2527968 RepID=A0A518GB84_9BACT|nr:hypothetical protein Q31a_41670 [Aureliella helgolandensis]
MSQLRFNQSCPVCGRKLLARIELFGKQVSCSHCHAEFRANNSQGYGKDF